MRRAPVACLLRSAFPKQADTLLLREDQCGGALFVAHWTHVPKAGGTALAGLARRIACAKNPQIKDLNPCCIQDFCADHRTCGGARLLQGRRRLRAPRDAGRAAEKSGARRAVRPSRTWSAAPGRGGTVGVIFRALTLT